MKLGTDIESPNKSKIFFSEDIDGDVRLHWQTQFILTLLILTKDTESEFELAAFSNPVFSRIRQWDYLIMIMPVIFIWEKIMMDISHPPWAFG